MHLSRFQLNTFQTERDHEYTLKLEMGDPQWLIIVHDNL